MTFGFDPNKQHSTGGGLIPAGTLAWANLTIRKLQHSQNTGGRMADYELTITEGPFATRKVWGFIGDPTDEANSEGFRTMGTAALQHICECAGLFDPAKPETYGRFQNFEEICRAIDGKRVGIKIGVKKGEDGYQDKNQVGGWLSPNPKAGTFKLFERLIKGDTEPKGGTAATAAPAQTGFSGFGNSGATQAPAAPQPAGVAAGQAPSWLGAQAK